LNIYGNFYVIKIRVGSGLVVFFGSTRKQEEC
jgi:hypothetical protein